MSRYRQFTVERLLVVVVLALATGMTWKYFGSPFLARRERASAASAIRGATPSTTGPSLGSIDARVVVLEFSDFQCPFCAAFARDTFARLKEKYVDTGKVRFVFNHLPLESIHKAAIPAAVAAECSLRQGAFWPAHDALFAHQKTLGTFAKDLGASLDLDRARFSSCLASKDAIAAVNGNIELAKTLGLSATPAFLIGFSLGPDAMEVGEVLVGSATLDAFSKAIDARLRAKR